MRPAIRHLGHVSLSEPRGVIVEGDDGRLLGPEVMDALRRHRHPGLSDGTEAGGLLLGRYVVDTQAVIADEVTEPAPGDLREPAAFHRLDDAHNAIIRARWEESDGRIHYVGEWHTHAEPWPRPSHIDLGAWEGLLRDASDGRPDNPPLLFVIAGQSSVGVWEGRMVEGP